MATLSLFELKDALTALGVSTATGDLRGKARRDELARRLQHHEWASGEVGLKEGRGEEGVQGLENLSLAELRSALELQQISTQTPGLKGDARRHALIQRLMNAYSNKQKAQDEISSRIGSSDEEEDDSRSETSSSAYSNATEFIFYDLLKERLEADPVLEMKATSPTPQLSLTWPKRAKESDVMALSSTHQLQRELFELRTQLHSARQEQQQRVEKALQEAGISTSLDEISTKLQALERERRRLQENYFGHELVTSDVLSSTGVKTY
ncbi:CAP-Gly domain-containing linker protein 2 [Phytophthora cinnamomi]|uniref:CAP-Gly domain-containing linker protein 2 n=1 Tax=Phytophthora cinnamomi TaxID=4785 RepID=UPI00355A64EC|nr:CAP-Gly domain-containing linker protein 2 [Phytophthora cinnamomi]